MSKLPTFFIPHGGGPCFFMDWNPQGTWDGMAEYLKGFAADIRNEVRSILVISAHWEEETIKVTGQPHPALVYDYYGFPPHTYELEWPAPGNPDLSREVAELLKKGGIDCALDLDRGFDHGVFIPFLLAFPDADIPTIQLSLSSGLSPELHFKIGELLAPLREKGVLIIGSGMSYHDVSALMGRTGISGAGEFDAWLEKSVMSDAGERQRRLLDWQHAPSARLSHPREEHLLPLHVVAGAARDDEARVDYRENILGADISAFRFG